MTSTPNYRVVYTRYDLDRPASFARSGPLPTVLTWLSGCVHPSGPNGPLWSANLYRPDGTLVPEEGWEEEILDAGYTPVFGTRWPEREYIAGAE